MPNLDCESYYFFHALKLWPILEELAPMLTATKALEELKVRVVVTILMSVYENVLWHNKGCNFDLLFV